MSLNIDMSEIIEFVLPTKSEYLEHDHKGRNNHNNNDDEEAEEAEEEEHEEEEDVETTVVGDQYVVLETVDMAGDYKHEEFLLVNDDGTETELLLSNADPELLQQAMLRIPKEEEADAEEDEQQYMMEHEELEDLVEEEQEEEEAKYEELQHYEEQYEDEQQQEPRYSWNYEPQQLQEQGDCFLDEDEDEELHEDALQEEEEQLQPPPQPQPLAKPSEKLLDMFKGPRRYMLFDELIATIVDFDDDATPIVEFSMIGCLQDEKLPVECGICPDVMHKSKLSKHQKTHLVPGTNRYACIYCSETYRDCKYLAGHARRHMGIRPYVCEPCKLYFSTKQDLRVHNQRRHLEKEHICEMCGKTFAQNTQLKRHREATHEKKRRFQCQYCQKAYYKNFSLQEHIRNVHMGKRRMLKCPFCGMQCRDAHKMARHRKEMHLNQDTYVCHLCQEEFTDINYFDAHKRSIQCRSNTRRLVDDNATTTIESEELRDATLMGDDEHGEQFVHESQDELADMLEEEYDEDAGLLLLEPNSYAEQQQQQLLFESINQQEEEEAIEEELQHYEDDALLVEQLNDEDDVEEQDEEQLLEEDEQQFLQQQAIAYQQQQQQQQLEAQQQLELEQLQPPLQQRQYNDDELIYEITLETEDT